MEYAFSSPADSPLEYRAHQEGDDNGSTCYSLGGGGPGSAMSSPARSVMTRANSKYEARPNNNFKVVIRTRPPLPRELNGDRPFVNIVSVDKDEHVMTICETSKVHDSYEDRPPQASHEDDSSLLSHQGNASSASLSSGGGPSASHVFTFDHVYDQASTQNKVYETTARGVVASALQGYNATILAYGQTGTGKTYTMEGFNREGNVEDRGIIPRAIEQIFGHISRHAGPCMRFLVRASYLQIYNEQISDLLRPERNNLAIREDKKRGVFVEGLSEWVVRSPAEIYGLMERGGAVRATGSTKMNEMSSRSHAVFIIIAEQSETTLLAAPEHHGEGRQGGSKGTARVVLDLTTGQAQGSGSGMGGGGVGGGGEGDKSHSRTCFKVGKLNLVDLAGSERVRLSGATGQRLEESKKINQSLSALGNVIAALTDPKGRTHIPYRDSKLTRILEDSLGGNCKTTMMAMISPALESLVETLSTLKFANRAKNIRNEAKVNEDLDHKSLLRKYERELKRLRAELEEKNRNVVDKRRLLELDEQRKRAEADKMAAIRALEARSLEFMREKEEKRRLEERIQMLTSQMIKGDRSTTHHYNNAGSCVGDECEQPHLVIKAQQERMRVEYEGRLAELERERESIVSEKAQVDFVKELLLKQRDIMIALTQRLCERDEQILALQDELDAYDLHQKALEEKLDDKTAEAIHLQRVILEANSGVRGSDLLKALSEWGSRASAPPSAPTHPAPQASTPSSNSTAPLTTERGDDADVVLHPLQAPDGATPSSASAPHQAPSDKNGPLNGVGGVPPQQLLTFPQFTPHDATARTLFTGKWEKGEGRRGGLLSAGEKIEELSQLLARQQQEMQRMAAELESVRADKVSAECVLREGLERRVAEEVDERMAPQRQELLSLRERVRGLSGEVQRRADEATEARRHEKGLQSQVSELRRQVAVQGAAAEGTQASDMQVALLRGHVLELEERLRVLQCMQASQAQGQIERQTKEGQAIEGQREGQREEGTGVAAAALLEKRCTTLLNQQVAVHTILESKIKILLQNISSTLVLVLQEAPQAAGGPAAQALRHNVTACLRLVNAFIEALRRAIADDSPKDGSPKDNSHRGGPLEGVAAWADSQEGNGKAADRLWLGGGERKASGAEDYGSPLQLGRGTEGKPPAPTSGHGKNRGNGVSPEGKGRGRGVESPRAMEGQPGRGPALEDGPAVKGKWGEREGAQESGAVQAQRVVVRDGRGLARVMAWAKGEQGMTGGDRR